MNHYRVKPDSSINLAEWDPRDKAMFEDGKRDAKGMLRELNERLEALQEVVVRGR